MTVDPVVDPQTARRDRRIVLAIAGLVAATILISTLVPALTGHAARAPAEDPTCAEWSDGCRVCRRIEDGIACSLPGIACTPGAMACLRHIREP